MADNMGEVVQLFQLALDPRHHMEAEARLKVEEKKPAFSLLLLKIVASDALPFSTRLSSAISFKNFIKYNYVDEDRNYKLPEVEVITIKQELIGLMISVPSSLQSQLGEAISLIADSDFWDRWDTLIDDLVSRLTIDNAKVNNGVLEVAHSIFKRWRPLFRSDELFTEILHVLSKFAEPFLKFLSTTDTQIMANKDNKGALEQHFLTMDLLIKLFYDLSCQDLPQLFEENLKDIVSLLNKYLVYENPLLNIDDDSQVGPVEQLKTDIFEVLVLYVQKYEDAFGEMLPAFIGTAWNLLTTVGQQTKYDLLVSKGLVFLTAVSGIPKHAAHFNSEGVLGEVVEKVILPSITLRESDIELFEDEPIEYIRKNLEGTDIDTRRRAATEFVRTLLGQFEALVTQVVLKYVSGYLAQFTVKPDEWISKDAAVYLFSAIAAQGTVTAAQGVRTTNKLVNVVEFFQNNVVGDLVGSAINPILKVDAINYLYTFRSQLTGSQWQEAFQPLVKNLESDNYVVYTYASIAVERVLSLTDDSGKHVFGREQVEPFAKDLLQALFFLIGKDDAPEKIQENEFLMRCLMRVLIVIKEGLIPITDIILQNLIQITKIIARNPANPRFYYYHFEALGALIRYAAPVQPEELENALFGPFSIVLAEDIEEFKPYVFQLFAALLEANPSGTLTEYYQNLIGPILTPDLWLSRGNVPALTRLLCSLIPRGAAHIVANNQIEQILGVFQNLVSKKSKIDIYAFDILETIVLSFKGNDLLKYFPVILQLVYSRLDDPTTSDAFKLRLVRFYHLVSSLNGSDHGYGTDYFIAASDSVQEGAFVPLYLKVILPLTAQFAKPLDRKLAAISLTKTLTDSQKFAVRYIKGWTLTCESLISIIENSPVIAADSNLIVEQDVDDVTFGVGFTQLNTCRRQTRDVWPEVGDIKTWVGRYFWAADQKAPAESKPTAWIQQRLSLQLAQQFQGYLKM